MAGVEDVLSVLRSMDGVAAAFLLDGAALDAAVAEERVAGTISGMPMENRALDECVRREVRVCLFCTGAFGDAEGRVLVMEDGDGNVLGHDVIGGRGAEADFGEDALWLSDDFVVFPGRRSAGGVRMVMLPRRVSSIGRAEGAGDPVLMYPSTGTDLLLKRLFRVPEGSKASSAILAFDRVS
ncbi:MAG: hypothetical protein LBG62_06325 [Candidatus Methanoplasma sp.]|jgi:hypothetical protein|nr:hypothetical protein [Candidatus Methanoplasma sp.]